MQTVLKLAYAPKGGHGNSENNEIDKRFFLFFFLSVIMILIQSEHLRIVFNSLIKKGISKMV